MSYTELYCDNAAGSNLNGGGLASGVPTDAANFTYAAGTFVRSTGVFTVASGDPASDGVAVGDFASIYTTAGATVSTFIARVTARDATTITVSLTAMSGATSSVSESAGAATCKVGGKWKGPIGAEDFPFGFVTSALRDASSNVGRINFHAGEVTGAEAGVYLPTAACIASNAGRIVWQGYTTTAGDGGRAIFDAKDNGVTLLSASGELQIFEDLEFRNNNAGTPVGIYVTGTNCVFRRCVLHDCRGTGFYLETAAGSPTLLDECEVYNCGKGGTGSAGIYAYIGGATINRCHVHSNDNTTPGISARTSVSIIDTICHHNSGDGFTNVTANSIISATNCDAYANGGCGFGFDNIGGIQILTNCNASANTSVGFAGYATGMMHLINCGGNGNSAFSSGTSREVDCHTYTSSTDPFTAPDTGDFRIAHADAAGGGRGTWLFTGERATYTAYADNVGAPVIGAVQSDSSVVPSEDDVRYGTTFGAYTGNMTLPTIAQVQSGVTFGTDGTEFTGELATSGDWTTGEKDQIRYRLGLDGDTDEPTATPNLGSIGSDWSTAEKNQIRHRLQIDGTQASPTDTDLPTVNVTQVNGEVVTESGTIDANVVQLNSNATAAATLKLFADMLDQATGQIDNGTFNMSIDGKSFLEAMQIIAAGCAGQTTGAGSGTEVYLGLDKTTPRIQVGISAGVGTTKNRASVDYL